MDNNDFDMNIDVNNGLTISDNNYAGNMQSFEEQQEINGYDNNYGDIVYDESSNNGIKDFINNNKKIVILVLIIVVFIIIFLLLRGCTAGSKVNSIVVKSDDIIYVGEESNIEVEASGSNTAETKYNFKLSNDALANLKEKEMSGSKVTNTVVAQNSGKLTIEVNASLGKTNAKNSKNILICKRLNDSSVIIEKLTLKKGRKIYLKDNLSLGVSECFNNLTYTSSDTSVASISGDGIVTANKPGSSTITISNGSSETTYIVEVKDIVNRTTGVSVNKTSVSLKVGSKATIMSSVKPNDATIKGVIWKSDNETIATVEKGVITGIKPGNAAITVTTVDGGHRAIINVNVTSKTNSDSSTRGNNSEGTSIGGNISEGNTDNIVVKPTNDNLVIKLEKSNLNYTKELYIIGTITSDVGISGYQITTSSNTPSKWINANNVKSLTIPETDTFKITKNGTYYVWTKNKNGDVKKSIININNITDKVANIALELSATNYTNSDVTIMGTITDKFQD